MRRDFWNGYVSANTATDRTRTTVQIAASQM